MQNDGVKRKSAPFFEKKPYPGPQFCSNFRRRSLRLGISESFGFPVLSDPFQLPRCVDGWWRLQFHDPCLICPSGRQVFLPLLVEIRVRRRTSSAQTLPDQPAYYAVVRQPSHNSMHPTLCGRCFHQLLAPRASHGALAQVIGKVVVRTLLCSTAG